jgi:hypothetical protein
VETYRNQHAPKFSKRENGNDAPTAALTSQDVTPSENRPEHRPSGTSIREMDMCAIQVFDQSINQSINHQSKTFIR